MPEAVREVNGEATAPPLQIRPLRGPRRGRAKPSGSVARVASHSAPESFIHAQAA